MDEIRLQQVLPRVFARRDSITSDIWHRDLIFRKGERCLIEAASGTVHSTPPDGPPCDAAHSACCSRSCACFPN